MAEEVHRPLIGKPARWYRKPVFWKRAIGGLVVAFLFVVGGHILLSANKSTDPESSINPTFRTTPDNALDDKPYPMSSKGPIETEVKSALLEKCDLHWFQQPLDHFGRKQGDLNATYMERYYICADAWKPLTGPIFFYVGNEADVTLYLNHSGLMWENRKEYGAMLVFAEHRYFGQSVPTETTSSGSTNMGYLSSEQALADYARLIRHIKSEQHAEKSAVIGFGGSYGGMLASWFRMKYPHILDGAIAGSAPILSFRGENPPIDAAAYSRIVSFDATAEAGSYPKCAENIRKSWDHMFEAGKTKEGRLMLQDTFKLCQKLHNESDVLALAEWAKDSYSSMAMGNYPYPSSYIMNGDSMLPAYPVRAACSHMVWDDAKDTTMPSASLLTALRNSISVFYNSTESVQCYDFNPPNSDSKKDGDYWGYLYCTEMCQPFDSNGKTDMFWPEKQDWKSQQENCRSQWGVEPRLDWATTVYGGRKALQYTSNIVFTNGNYDPWSGLGVTSSVSDSVVAVMIEGGAHHLDLMFSNELDPPSVLQARATQKEHMWRWIYQAGNRTI